MAPSLLGVTFPPSHFLFFIQGFTKSLAMTVLSEIGDKTFFPAAAAATLRSQRSPQHPRSWKVRRALPFFQRVSCSVDRDWKTIEACVGSKTVIQDSHTEVLLEGSEEWCARASTPTSGQNERQLIHVHRKHLIMFLKLFYYKDNLPSGSKVLSCLWILLL
ncbi:hypothetical protein ZEAMMB73_Zm00001d025769 [Zea mays]|uniref:GDT1 family protein n=1 Tax=Zea mays TaxID=4577 RepID=A0A1D6J9E2_MAIZE|nr:hypothetical protein ZEAMMB73_Zm00001d025769 [Zea mays]AQK44537.1 hypothetical protein ZEAMMB73_Zm00001d025769 [Zea mays]